MPFRVLSLYSRIMFLNTGQLLGAVPELVLTAV